MWNAREMWMCVEQNQKKREYINASRKRELERESAQAQAMDRKEQKWFDAYKLTNMNVERKQELKTRHKL